MVPIDRRLVFVGLVSGLAGLAASRGNARAVGQTAPATAGGHAAGLGVAPPAFFNSLVPRRSGEAAFTASLDTAAIKATSGGWARKVTTRELPLATRIAGAHLVLNPGRTRCHRDLRRRARHV